MTTTKSNLSQRQYHLDYLRVFDSLAIILLHVVCQNMSYVEPAGTEWSIYNFCNGLSRWGVPVFIMMSGALFLSREIPTKKLYTKYISRLAISFGVWSLFYAFVNPIGELLFKDNYTISIQEIINHFISGEVHLWFIPMLIGLYMCIPFMKTFVNNKSTTKYFLLLSFIFLFLRTQINLITDNLITGSATDTIDSINTLFNHINISMVLGYSCYFILGYVLNKEDIPSGTRKLIYAGGIVGFIGTIGLNYLVAKNNNATTEAFYNASSINILLVSVAIFVFFRYNITGVACLNKLIVKLSKYSFGAYLSHIFVLKVLAAFNIQSTSFHPLLSVPAITIFTAIVSYLISFILNKIPIIKKYIV